MPPRRTVNSALVVPNGKLVRASNRDDRFPRLYKVNKHALDPEPAVDKNIYVFVQDTSPEAMEEFGEFEKSLKAPFGRSSGMASRGLIEIPVPAVVYGRRKGCTDEKQDVLVAFMTDVTKTLPEEAANLNSCVDRIRGPEHLITQEQPTPENGMTGGLHFERLGQDRVKDSRAISLSVTLQRATQIYGPAASAKNKVGREESQEIRAESIKCSSDIALKTMRSFAPRNMMTLLERTGRFGASPHIGTHGNTMFPAIQLNISNPVGSDQCAQVGNDHLGLFGKPHVDKEDSPGSLTCMIASGHLPPEYEPGRFHLLHLGVYFVMHSGYAVGFSGLHYHVGTPPIAPTNDVAPHVTRLMFVLYPTQSAFPEKTTVVTPFASWPGGELLKLGPEFTTFAGSRQPIVAEGSHLSVDGDKLMERPDFLDLMARYSLLLLNHVWRQIPARNGAAIDTDRFMSAFSMMHEGHRITAKSWPEGPDGRAEIPELDTPMEGVPVGDRDENSRHHARREATLDWVAHLERYSAFIPSWRSTDFKALKESIMLDVPSGRNQAFKRHSKADLHRHHARPQTRGSGKHDLDGAMPESSIQSVTDRRRTRAMAAVQVEPVADPLDRRIGPITRSSAKPVGNVMQPPSNPYPSPDATPIRPLTRASVKFATVHPPSESEATKVNAQKRKAAAALPDSPLSKKHHDSLTRSATHADEMTEQRMRESDNRKHRLQDVMAAFSMKNIQLFKSTISAALAQHPSAANDAIPVCNSAIMLMESSPLSTGTVVAVGRAGEAMSAIQRSLDSMQLHQRLHQRRIMVTVSAVHGWIHQTVETALKSPAASTWPCNLIAHFRDKMSGSYERQGRTVTIYLRDFVPEASQNDTSFTYVIPPRPGDKVEQDNRIKKRAVDALQVWLGYSGDKGKEGIALLLSLRQCPLYETLFIMDEIWQIYQRPFSTLIHGGVGYSRLSSWTQSVLDMFHNEFAAHPICDPTSLEYHALAEVRDMFNGVSVLHSCFSHFLRGLLPILGPVTPTREQNQLAHFVSAKPDLYSPFRLTAPTLSHALRVIYGKRDMVRTFNGLFNILCFRGVFYGSDYARNDLQWLNGYNAWKAIRDGYQGQKKSANFFVNKSAYTTGQQSRNVDVIDTHYRYISARHVKQWASMIDTQSSPRQFFHFLRPFHNIGPSTSLLIVGDLAQAGIINEPTLEDMAHFIHQGGRAAMQGLQTLGLIWSSAVESDILHALETLHQCVITQFTPDELVTMGYDNITLEHALGQFHRIQERKPQGLFQ